MREHIRFRFIRPYFRVIDLNETVACPVRPESACRVGLADCIDRKGTAFSGVRIELFFGIPDLSICRYREDTIIPGYQKTCVIYPKSEPLCRRVSGSSTFLYELMGVSVVTVCIRVSNTAPAPFPVLRSGRPGRPPGHSARAGRKPPSSHERPSASDCVADVPGDSG